MNTTYFYTYKYCCENILYTIIYSPHCMRIFDEQKMSSKYTKIVINGPKMISCFRNKTENRRKIN